MYRKTFGYSLFDFLADAEKFEDYIQTAHKEELALLLQMFHDWQSNHPGNQLLILSGDVHLGGFTDIYIKVWVEGPIDPHWVFR